MLNPVHDIDVVNYLLAVDNNRLENLLPQLWLQIVNATVCWMNVKAIPEWLCYGLQSPVECLLRARILAAVSTELILSLCVGIDNVRKCWKDLLKMGKLELGAFLVVWEVLLWLWQLCLVFDWSRHDQSLSVTLFDQTAYLADLRLLLGIVVTQSHNQWN